MNEIIAVPTVKQINLEHQLAQSKATEAIQHAVICGLMLLQVKASLKHGEWLPWLKQQQDSGAIGFSERSARDYMRLAADRQHAANLPATSIRAALELLSDKNDAAQGELLPPEPAKAEPDANTAKIADLEKALEEYRDHSAYFREQAYAESAKAQDLKRQVQELQNRQADPDPNVLQAMEVAQKEAAQLAEELATLKKSQAQLVGDQVKAKLREVQKDVDLAEERRRVAERMEREARQRIDDENLGELAILKYHDDAIHNIEVALADLAVFLVDADPISHSGTLKKWRSLAIQMRHGGAVIDGYVANSPSQTETKIVDAA